MLSRRFERVSETLARRQPDLTIAMENVHKARNLGAVARTCDAVGIGVIHAVAPAGSSVKLGHKAASGTEKWVTVRRHSSIGAAYALMRQDGFSLLAADVGRDTIDFRDLDYTVPTALILGSELDGLSEEAVANADHRVHVPLMGMVESLNVSVAAGIILYEAARQREVAGYYRTRRIGDEEYRQCLFEWLHPSVADYCRQRRLPYPDLDQRGEICQSVSGNPRVGISGLDEKSRAYLKAD